MNHTSFLFLKQNFILKVEAFGYFSISQLWKKLKKIFQKKGTPFLFHLLSTVTLPLQISKFTVERSPHIFKKSREQFLRKRYKSIFQFGDQNTNQSYYLFFLFQILKLKGVCIDIQYSSFDFL